MVDVNNWKCDICEESKMKEISEDLMWCPFCGSLCNVKYYAFQTWTSSKLARKFEINKERG
jgi:hypothetical protein